MNKIEDYMIVPPHLNAEAYRNDTTGNGIVSYLDYIKIHSDGTALVGSSEITGRYWDGGASVFDKVSDGKTIEGYEKRSINLNSGTADGCFIKDSDKVLIVEDNGSVSIWGKNKNNPWQEWSAEKAVAEHDDGALGVDCLNPGKEYVTVGADGKAKVWDMEDLICMKTYEAHTRSTHAVATRPDSTNMFATASYDGYVTLWDTNLNLAAAYMGKNNCGVRALQWIDGFRLIFGDDAGILGLFDARNTILQKPTIIKLGEFPAGIHKLALNSKGNKVAVCCDNSIVSVCTIDGTTCRETYHDRHMHRNFVRGMAWDNNDPNLLHTVGWDSVILSHNIE